MEKLNDDNSKMDPRLLKDILTFDYLVLVDLSHRTDGQGLPLAQWMFDHGMDKETALTAMENMCGAYRKPKSESKSESDLGVNGIELIEWIVKSYELKLEDICPDDDDYCECIVAACRHGYTDLVIKLNEWFDIPNQGPAFRLTTGLQMIVEMVTSYMDTNTLLTQKQQGYPMIMWVITTLDLKCLLPKDDESLRDLIYEMSGTERNMEGMNGYRVDVICQLLKGDTP